MIKILIICGKTSSGKNAVVNKLVNEYGYRQVVTSTTRPMRKGEQQDVTYHFISEEDFIQKIREGLFSEYKTYNTEFGTWYYGTAVEDLENADEKSVIILTPQGYRDVKSKFPEKDITCIYLYADNETLKKRLKIRDDNPKEAARRLTHDDEDFKDFEKESDKIVYNNFDADINEVIKKILDFVEDK